MEQIMKTRKLLVAFEPEKRSLHTSEFVFPILIDNQVVLYGLSSGKVFEYGVVARILTKNNNGVTMEEFLAKAVKAGIEVADIEQMQNSIQQYFKIIDTFKFSNVLKATINSNHQLSFEKTKLKVYSSDLPSKLP